MIKKEKMIVYAIVLLLLVIIILILVHLTISDYRSFRGHQSYLRNSTSLKIESWMTPYTISRHFNISEEQVFQVLNITNNMNNLRTPLDNLCKYNKLNCTDVINNLSQRGE